MGPGARIRRLSLYWGAQGGLLSEAECDRLYNVFREAHRVLEVGHYYGLSTRVLSDAIDNELGTLITIDSHEGSPEDNVDAPSFELFHQQTSAGNVIPLVMRSEALQAPLQFDAVFYDGDHEEEQARFTRVVHDSPRVKLFVFDDRDFPVPESACEALRAAGWTDESPPLYRGQGDKTDPKTMTLGVFRRAR